MDGANLKSRDVSYLIVSLILGVVAGLANVFGGLIVSARPWSRTFLSYFIALGSGFMLATTLTEMIPESLKFSSPFLRFFCARSGIVRHRPATMLRRN